MIKPFLRVLPLCAATFLLNACDKNPEPRRYREIVTQGKDGMGAGQSSRIQNGPLGELSWTLPAGWTVQPEGDPMRLTGFWAPDPALAAKGETDPQAVDVSIVQLAGDAGGLEANVTRWLGQVKIPASFAAQVIAQAAPIQTATGQKGIVVDFTALLSGDMTQSESIVGAILDGGGYTLFVKAKGGRERLVKIKPQLLEFCRGLSLGKENATTATTVEVAP